MSHLSTSAPKQVLEYVTSYTSFSQGTALASINVVSSEGICLAIAYFWLRCHMDAPKAYADSRIQSILNNLHGLVSYQAKYSQAQRPFRERTERGLKLSKVASIMSNRGLELLQQGREFGVEVNSTGALIAQLAKEHVTSTLKFSRAVPNVSDSGNSVQTSLALLGLAGRLKLSVDASWEGIIDSSQGKPYLDLVATLKKGEYWMIGLGSEHAIAVYVYTSIFWSDYLICFDPNFGEFQVPLDQAALFFLKFLAYVPAYSKYKKLRLYRVAPK